ncbi:MAG: beta-ketoacyl synthase chain length factor [Sulfurimonas sp.]|nr:beta-ketoacyl synthase chain length factor [Sulfurimonas sp.]
MKINVEITKKAFVHNKLKIEDLNEKELVQKMLIRRRLSRSSRILINLAHKCDFTAGVMVYGSAYGELIDTVNILEAIKNNDMVSPSAFQNSVYNTAASYHSIVHGNTSEILTLSCGDETSYNVMQQAALSLLKEDEVFVCVVEAMNFDGVDSLNKCANELEYGISFVLKQSEKEVNVIVQNKIQKGVPSSLSWMKNLYDLCENNDGCVVEVEL